MPRIADSPAIPSAGWAVLHLVFAIAGDRTDELDLSEAQGLIDAFEAEQDAQVISFSAVGAGADFGLILVHPDLTCVHRLHRDLMRTALGDVLIEVPEKSMVSITEASEYINPDNPNVEQLREGRLHPRNLPDTRLVCIYPMSKSREVGANWYAQDFEERRRLMGGHGRLGGTFAGRVSQMITAATGLSDWEWQVTLFADDPKAIKDIVYEMR
ncbi:MAG: chlorite dismutase family protein, partial [Thermoleophilia bacterium]